IIIKTFSHIINFYACSKFRHFIYGRKFIAWTDHKPLVSITNKNVSEIPSIRLQKMRIKLFEYDIELKYLPGNNMHIPLSTIKKNCKQWVFNCIQKYVVTILFYAFFFHLLINWIFKIKYNFSSNNYSFFGWSLKVINLTVTSSLSSLSVQRSVQNLVLHFQSTRLSTRTFPPQQAAVPIHNNSFHRLFNRATAPTDSKTLDSFSDSTSTTKLTISERSITLPTSVPTKTITISSLAHPPTSPTTTCPPLIIPNLIPTSITAKSASNSQITIQTADPTHFPLIQTTLIANKSIFHTFSLPEERTLKVVFKGIPIDIHTNELISELQSLNFSVKFVRRFGTPEKPMPIYLITVKALKSSGPAHCFSCLRSGHGSRNCGHPPRCVKCAGNYTANLCPTTHEQTPTCCSCGGPHTANIRGCPKFLAQKQDKTYTPSPSTSELLIQDTVPPKPSLPVPTTPPPPVQNSSLTYATTTCGPATSTPNSPVPQLNFQLILTLLTNLFLNDIPPVRGSPAHGGTAVLIHRRIVHRPMTLITSIQTSSVLTQLNDYEILISAVYKLPGTTLTRPADSERGISDYSITVPPFPTHFPTNTKYKPDILDLALVRLPYTTQIYNLKELSSDHNTILLDTLCTPISSSNSTTNRFINFTKYKTILTNYRPIALLSSLSKMYEDLILTHLQTNLRNKISSKQFFTHQLSQIFNNNVNTASIFLDVEKVFDRVWHEGLLYKLSKLNIPTEIVKLFLLTVHSLQKLITLSLPSEKFSQA
ncbi:hypothetical protein QTP88_021351, partial [Uroleucon formosanum]